MKFFIHIALFLIITSACFSCSKVEPSASGEMMSVSYTISLIDTKGVSADGGAINKVWYALYNTDGTLATNYAPVDFVDGSAGCEVVVMRGQSYKLVFVAQHYKSGSIPTYPINAQSGTINIPDSPVANSDEYDLFYGSDDIIAYNGTPTGSIALDRVVAMVNFISSDEDWNSAVSNSTVPTHSSITLSGVASQWNLLTGKANGNKTDITFGKAPIPADKHVGAAYFFADGDINATLNIYNSGDEGVSPMKTTSVYQVQVEQNKKTNIVGGIITGAANTTNTAITY